MPLSEIERRSIISMQSLKKYEGLCAQTVSNKMDITIGFPYRTCPIHDKSIVNTTEMHQCLQIFNIFINTISDGYLQNNHNQCP